MIAAKHTQFSTRLDQGGLEPIVMGPFGHAGNEMIGAATQLRMVGRLREQAGLGAYKVTLMRDGQTTQVWEG